MSRDRYRRRYEDLRSFELAQLPKSARLPSARWTANGEWAESLSQDGATLRIEKAHDGALSVEYQRGECAIAERVLLAFEPRPFGGVRVYLRCPLCGRRCTTLYIVEPAMRCRSCLGTLYGVIYASQGTNAVGRALRRFIKLRARICPGTERADLTYFPDRPKAMRHTTYARIKAEALDALHRYWGALDARLAPKLTRMLDRMAAKSD